MWRHERGEKMTDDRSDKSSDIDETIPAEEVATRLAQEIEARAETSHRTVVEEGEDAGEDPVHERHGPGPLFLLILCVYVYIYIYV